MIEEYTKRFPSFAGLGKKAPGVTTTLIVDNTAYISSSANSAGTFLYLPNGNREGSRFTQLNPAHPCKGSVEQALTRCQLRAVNSDTGHRTGASCGEPMAALAFCATNNQRSLDNAKIVSITGKDKYKIVPPCGHPDGHLTYDGEWGCHSFIEELAMGMHVLSADTGRTATDVSDDDIAISYATYP
ncbi:hypothetical protein M409DRAFT_23754 [Zasmidium cellare ATCC 36951]|uniref:Uncharacterized protein n=1 Tax=Zasmidium cellare ATCC 36951 TaxID=1080233 RepID=A0A6A6CKT4_ZASCE|nr:uncharacterized protein M409DRAFT_23754 [Zasmidium cellare ATCC 36951]KAF2166026.1 hypothetical protein M409DRAFT_23754 [Zasmidium cellare ATCC 36951]